MKDLISRQAAIDALCSVCGVDCDKSEFVYDGKQEDQVILCPEHYVLTQLPSAQPEQRYTEEELMVFRHGISLSLLSKRSAQHWRYDEDTATEIEFLERLYDKVSADMRGEQDDESRSNSNAQTDTRARGMGATDKSSGI